MLRSYARQDSQNYASSLREQIGGRPPYPGRAFARRQISRSLMLLRDRTGSKRRADLCRANRRAAAACRSLVLQRDTEGVLPRRLLRKARRNDEAKIDIDRPSPTESTRLPVPAKSRPGATPAPVAFQRRRIRVKFVTRLGVSSSLAPNVRPRRPAFLCSGSARLVGGPFQASFTPCFRCRGAGREYRAGSRAWAALIDRSSLK